ncbi:methyltransferase-like protein 22 isoform X2 [Ornithodoros turicata]|uniref:methyltransferase-like protein 22 isoform X2 n=1 Tax=Ornithodoros turicata TaxID=34597 RepID=UPI003139B1E3
MFENEVVLSEIHIDSENVPVADDSLQPHASEQVVQSRFRFKFPVRTKTDSRPRNVLEVDEDGDLLVQRPDSTESYVIIDHFLATPLRSVGLQVWKGALLLSDFLLCGGVPEGKTVLELGGGTGLCSIVAAISADTVYCTDKGDDILRLCRRNMDQNDHLYSGDFEKVHVRELDWTKDDPFVEGDGPWCWTSADRCNVKKIDVFLAADVVYDNSLTDSFVETLERLVRNSDQVAYVALEKRINFTLDDLDVVSPAHSYFVGHLGRLLGNGWAVEKVSTEFPQSFRYTRDKYLELWKLSAPTICT